MKRKIIYLIVIILLIVLSIGTYLFLNNHKTTSSSPFNVSNGPSVKIDNFIAIQKNSSYGSYLSEPDGQTLYIYTQDTFNKSNCNGECLKLWPAYLENNNKTSGLPINFGLIKSENGFQYTYKGKPLYTYLNDKVNQINGQNVGGFELARP